MKNKITIFLLLLATFLLAACGGNSVDYSENTTYTDIIEGVDEQNICRTPMSLFQAVLQNERQFYCRFWGFIYLDGLLHQPTSIAVFDMNGDGVPEMIINFSYVIKYVFHYHDGEVFGSEFGIRSMNAIMTDGRFFLSPGGAGNFGIGELIINGGTADILSIYSFDAVWVDRNNYPHEIHYNLLNGVNVSDEEFEIWYASVTSRELINWYPFSGENIQSLALLITPRYVPDSYENNNEAYTEFVTTIRIHPDMPEFTFIRRLGNFITDWIMSEEERHVTITILDENGNLIQQIDGLIQGGHSGWMSADLGMFEIQFADLNFNGYLDMWLTHAVNPGTAGGYWAYYWLWNPEYGQFVLNEQLGKISDMAALHANQDTGQIEIISRGGPNLRYISYYEYVNGVFALIATEQHVFDSNDDDGWQWTITRTNAQTGKIDIEVIPANAHGIALVAPGTEFVTTIRIHPDMPEFTITRIVGDYLSDDYFFPEPREVNIIITDENGAIIQEISGLTQSSRNVNGGLSFDDYNFDGYLDMRLLRWQDGAGGLLAQEYFWLWDASTMQFVMHEQLMGIGHSAWLGADQERQRVYVGNRNLGGHAHLEYEYRNGEFFVVRRGFTWPFDTPTGERYVIIMDARLLPNVLEGINDYEVDIIIETISGEIVQEILGLTSSYRYSRTMTCDIFCLFNPLNFHVYALGAIKMGSRYSPDGSLMDDPHYFWLWEPETGQFVETYSIF